MWVGHQHAGLAGSNQRDIIPDVIQLGIVSFKLGSDSDKISLSLGRTPIRDRYFTGDEIC
jgi:hypothetical protein